MNRSFRRLMILWFAMVLDPAGLLSPARGAEVPSLDEILRMEKQVIESRRAIRSGRVTLRAASTVVGNVATMANPVTRWVTFFDGEKSRCDREHGVGLPDSHREQTILTSDTYIRAGAADRPVDLFGPESLPKGMRLPDPRRLGLVCWFFDTISEMGYEEVFLNPNRDRFKIESGTDPAGPVWTVSCRITFGDNELQAEYRLSPSHDGLPVYLGLSYPEGNGQTVRSIATKLKKYKNGPGEVWYPSEVVLRFTHEGKVREEQIVTVEDAVFGERMPDETFTLAGLGLAKGRRVLSGVTFLVWDGKQLAADASEVAFPPVEASPPRAGKSRVFLVALSVVLALAAAALLWHRSMRRRTAGLGTHE